MLTKVIKLFGYSYFLRPFFGAALSKLCKEDLNTLTADKLEGILAFANKAASITTSRRGAIPVSYTHLDTFSKERYTWIL